MRKTRDDENYERVRPNSDPTRDVKYRILDYENRNPKLVERRHRILFNNIKIIKLPDISALKTEDRQTEYQIVAHCRHKYTNYDYLRRKYEREFTRDDLNIALPAEINRRICVVLGFEYKNDMQFFSEVKQNGIRKPSLF